MEHNFCPHCSGRVLEILHRIERRQIMDQAQLLTDLNIANTGIKKIGTETRTLLDKIDALQQAIANGGTVTPEVEAAMNDLNAQIVVVDAMVPDAPPAPAAASTDTPTA